MCRLRGGVRRAVQREQAQEHVLPGVPQVLQRVPLRAGGHGRQPGDLRQVLHGLDHARQQDQVPVNGRGSATPHMHACVVCLSLLEILASSSLLRVDVGVCVCYLLRNQALPHFYYRRVGGSSWLGRVFWRAGACCFSCVKMSVFYCMSSCFSSKTLCDQCAVCAVTCTAYLTCNRFHVRRCFAPLKQR